MSFIDTPTVPNGKVDKDPVPAGQENMFLSADEHNNGICQPLLDLRTHILGGFFGFAERSNNPINSVGDTSTTNIWAKSNGNLMFSRSAVDKIVAQGAVSTKGDLLVFNGTNFVVVPAGSDTQVLTANSGVGAGVAWANAAGGGISGLTSNTIPKATSGTTIGDSNITLVGSVVTVTGSPGAYQQKWTDGTHIGGLFLTSTSAQIGTVSNHNFEVITNNGNAQATFYASGNVSFAAAGSTQDRSTRLGVEGNSYLNGTLRLIGLATLDVAPSLHGYVVDPGFTTPTSGQVLAYDSTNGFIPSTLTGLPSQTSANGKYLTSNGTSASWGTVTLQTLFDGLSGVVDTVTNAMVVKHNGLGATATQPYFTVANQTASSSGTPNQYSPILGLTGTVYNTTSTLSQQVLGGIYMKPVSAATPTVTMNFLASADGSTINDVMDLSATGTHVIKSFAPDGASVVGTKFDTSSNYTNASSYISAFYNNNVFKVGIFNDGSLITADGARFKNTVGTNYLLLSSASGTVLAYGSTTLTLGSALTSISNVSDGATAKAYDFGTANVLATAGAAVSRFISSTNSSVYIGMFTGAAATAPATIAIDIVCSGTVTAGQILVWTGTNQVAAAAATLNLTTIAGVAVTGGTNASIKMAVAGRCLVNSDAGITVGQTVSTSASTAGNAQATVAPVLGALLGRATEATGATAANKVTVDLVLA